MDWEGKSIYYPICLKTVIVYAEDNHAATWFLDETDLTHICINLLSKLPFIRNPGQRTPLWEGYDRAISSGFWDLDNSLECTN